MNIGKCQKLVCNMFDKKELCHTHKSPKAGLGLWIVHRVIKFNQEAWLMRYIDMNTELRKNDQK